MAQVRQLSAIVASANGRGDASILAGPPGTFDDPEKRLSGGGKTGRHLKLRSVGELPTKAVRGWLSTAAELARKQA